MAIATTEGLQAAADAAAELSEGQWAIAAGTADVITAIYPTTVTSLTDGLRLAFRATAANATTTPTFAPDGLTAHTITKRGGEALLPGDIPGALAEVEVRYNLANTRWEILYIVPSSSVARSWAAAGGTADALTVTLSPALLTIPDGTIVSFRASTPNLTTTPTLAVSGLTARTITKIGGQALAAYDIPSANYEVMVRYNLANTRWEMLNPNPEDLPWVVAGGTADALTLTTSAPTALYDGMIVSFRAAATNATTTPTLNLNSFGALTITKRGGNALTSGDIQILGEYIVRYNLANTRWELLNPSNNIVPPWGVTAGSATAFTLTLPVLFTEFDGFTIGFRATNANSGTTPTLAINGGTARTIVKRFSTAVAANDMVAGGEYILRYNLANTRWVLLNPVVN